VRVIYVLNVVHFILKLAVRLNTELATTLSLHRPRKVRCTPVLLNLIQAANLVYDCVNINLHDSQALVNEHLLRIHHDLVLINLNHVK